MILPPFAKRRLICTASAAVRLTTRSRPHRSAHRTPVLELGTRSLSISTIMDTASTQPALAAAPSLAWSAEEDAENAYLEEVLGERAISFVDDRNAKAVDALGNPQDSEDYARVLAILDSKDKIPHLRKIHGMFYNFWQDATNPRGVIRRLSSMEAYRSPQPDWELVLDIDALGKAEGESWVYKGQNPLDLPSEIHPPGSYPKRTLLSLSRGGGDATVVREFDLDTKQFISPDGEEQGIYVPEAKSRLDWIDMNTLLIGTDFEKASGVSGDGLPPSLTDSGYPISVRVWTRGTPINSAIETYRGEPSDVSISGYVSYHRGTCLEWRSRAITFYTARYQLRRWQIAPPSASTAVEETEKNSAGYIFRNTDEWFELTGLPEDCEVSSFGDCLVITLRSDWKISNSVTYKSGSLLSVQIVNFLENGNNVGEPNTAQYDVLFEPTAETSLEGFTVTQNFLIVQSLQKVKSMLTFWKYESSDGSASCWSYAGSESEARIRGISVRSVDSDEGDELWVTHASYLQPSTLYLTDAALGPAGIPSGPSEAQLKALPSQFDASGLVESQREAVSADGTKIPYFVIGRGDMPFDGSTPTLLYGYGGFEISMTPSYLGVTGLMWLERGGCYVVANIRGGGEFGPSWHQAALKENRNKAYEDFIAVAEDLVRCGITSTPHLGIRGGSNGGLLMGNMMIMRPDLFGAVVCAVPLLDMKRYSKLLAGASWMAEYGNPDTNDWNAFLHKYSAYHHIDRDTASTGKYPPFLMTTSTLDDRVHPYHARSFVKRLLQAGCSEGKVLYYENKEGGHGGAADSKQQAYMTILYIAFLWRHLA